MYVDYPVAVIHQRNKSHSTGALKEEGRRSRQMQVTAGPISGVEDEFGMENRGRVECGSPREIPRGEIAL